MESSVNQEYIVVINGGDYLVCIHDVPCFAETNRAQ